MKTGANMRKYFSYRDKTRNDFSFVYYCNKNSLQHDLKKGCESSSDTD